MPASTNARPLPLPAPCPQFLRWTAPVDGFVIAYACSDVFQASLNVIGDGKDADGAPIVNGTLGCGGVFDSCSDPNLDVPDSQLV